MINHREFSVQKKSNYKFLHADRLRESEINFVFCEWELYDGTAPEQKTESAKNGLDSMSKPFFNPSECKQVAPTSICNGGKKVYLIPGASKSGSCLGRGELNGVFIINFVKFIKTRNFFRRGALQPLCRQFKSKDTDVSLLLTYLVLTLLTFDQAE